LHPLEKRRLVTAHVDLPTFVIARVTGYVAPIQTPRLTSKREGSNHSLIASGA